MVYRFALRGANVVTANAHRGLPPAAEPACLPAGNPLTRAAGRNGYRPCFAGAREEARTGGGRHPDLPTRTAGGLDTARVITRSCPTSASWCSPRTSKSAMRWQIGSRGLATSQSVYCPPPHGRPQTEARLPASVHRGRSGRWPPPRPVDPAGRVLPDPDARLPGHGASLLRAGHP